MNFKSSIMIGALIILHLISAQRAFSAKKVINSPIVNSISTNKNGIIISFSNTSGGFVSNASSSDFMICGKDKKFYPATQILVQKNKITLSSTSVNQPIAVRYGYGNVLNDSILTKNGTVLKPFRTDTFNNISYARWFADSEMKRFPEAWQLDHGKRLYFGYSQGLGSLAMLNMWKQTGDKRYFDYVKNWADTLITEDGKIHEYHVETYNIDYINSGKVLFDVYKQTGESKYKKTMDNLINQMKNHPRTLEGGYWHKLIYQHQIWLDGIYMGSPFLAQYGKEFNQPEWLDEAIHQITLCHSKCYNPETGLYYHAWDESKKQLWANKQTGLSPNFWGRSIGWYFMAVVDALDFIPENHPRRTELIAIVQNLTIAMGKYQSKNGLWFQVVDKPEGKGNYEEASVTSMCMYSIAKAINKGYVDKKYRIISEKAHKGIVNNLLIVSKNGTLTLTKCCAVAGLGGNPYRNGSYEYYIGERIRDNDAKATGPFIMGCIELEK